MKNSGRMVDCMKKAYIFILFSFALGAFIVGMFAGIGFAKYDIKHMQVL